jgi:dihydroorotate dehydrogenase electron transfer subunit
LTTEDGSRGARGYVTQAAEAFLTPETGIYVCGPTPMMQAALGMVQKRGLEAFLSLENQMGCGVGACMGCVVPGREGLIRVCHDGPVVSSNKLDRLLVE